METMRVDPKLESILTYYAHPGVMSDAGRYTPLLSALPGDLPGLVRVIQGLALHIFWAERYGVKLPEERKAEVQIRGMQAKLSRIIELDAQPLSEPRENGRKLVCNCRDFSLMLASALIAHGIPARARCGFGTYFIPGHYEDHWMTEVWSQAESRWLQVDGQLDALQKQVLGIQFDTLDMPHRAFVLAGDAWLMCRRGEADPDHFGIFDMKGWDFIHGNLMRDFLALNKVEVLPWDFWTATQVAVADFTPEQMERADKIAALTLQENAAFELVRELYENDSTFHIPADWAG